MVVARHIRGPALFALAAALSYFAHQVEATSSPSLSLSACTTTCVQTQSCEGDDTLCICKGARSKLLVQVAQCTYNSCPDELRSFESAFLSPVTSACKSIGRQIPQSKVDEAEKAAEFLASRLPTTTKTTSTSAARATPKTTATQATTSSSSESKKTTTTVAPVTTSTTTPAKTTSSTSTDDDESSSTTSTTSEEDSATTTTTDRALTTSPTTLATTTSATRAETRSSSTSTKSAGRPDPTDSSPFATPRKSAGRSNHVSWVLAGLPVALAVAMR